MGTQRAASAGAAWGHTAALLLPTCAPHWWRTRFNCRLINEDCSHSDTKPAWGPNAAPAKQQNLSDHLPVPLSAVTAPKNCASSRKMGTQTPIQQLWGRDPQPPDPHLQQEGDTHEAGRSCRRSMVKTTASSPADRKVHGESGSRASCKINTRALVPFSPNNALESLSPHNPPHIPAPSTPHGCVLLCQAAQQGPSSAPPPSVSLAHGGKGHFEGSPCEKLPCAVPHAWCSCSTAWPRAQPPAPARPEHTWPAWSHRCWGGTWPGRQQAEVRAHSRA